MTRAILAALAAGLFVLGTVSAEAKPRRVASAAIITCNEQGCSDWLLPAPVRKGKAVAVQGVAYASSLVSSARQHMGATASQLGLPARLWCADFANLVLRSQGFVGTGSRAARSFLTLPRTRASVGAIAVLSRGKRGGHVGFVSGFDARGNPIIVSGNHNRRVGEAAYPAHRVIAYVRPA